MSDASTSLGTAYTGDDSSTIAGYIKNQTFFFKSEAWKGSL